MSKISIIAAVDRRMGIGYQNKLLFWLPNDVDMLFFMAAL